MLHIQVTQKISCYFCNIVRREISEELEEHDLDQNYWLQRMNEECPFCPYAKDSEYIRFI